MIPNTNLYNDTTITISFIMGCLIVLAIVMIPKAIRHRKQMKQKESEKLNSSEDQEIELMVVPTNEIKKTIYKEKFLRRNKIRYRDCIYISYDVHTKLLLLSKTFDDITIGGYVDNVMKEHFEEYKDEINSIFSESKKELL